jgi:hypothetical protein
LHTYSSESQATITLHKLLQPTLVLSSLLQHPLVVAWPRHSNKDRLHAPATQELHLLTVDSGVSRSQSQSRSYFTTSGLPPIIYLGVKSFDTHDQRFPSPQLNLCGNSPYVTSSLTRRWVYPL